MKKIVIVSYVVFSIQFSIFNSFAQSTVPVPRAPVQWIRTVIDQGIGMPQGMPGELAIGIGRNDGIKRLYGAGVNGNLVEYTWNGTGWTKFTIFTGTNYKGIVIGQARATDNFNRLYCNHGRQLWEVSYSGGVWSQSMITSAPLGQVIEFVLMGVGRNDGIKRLYVSISNGVIQELRYDGANWILENTISLQTSASALGNGRNDGTNRLYGAGNARGLYELTYSAGAWQSALVGTWPNPHRLGVGNYLDAVIANGQNDGVLRVFSNATDEAFYYYTYSGGTWNLQQINTDYLNYDYGKSFNGWLNTWGFGPRSGQTVNRLYVAGPLFSHYNPQGIANDTVYVHEFSYNVPSGWEKQIVSWIGIGDGAALAIGDARGDGRTRIYGACTGGEVVEVSYGR